MGSISVRLAKRDSVELDFERQIKPYTSAKILADFFNRLQIFDLSKPLFVLSKFARNLLTNNRRESFNRERRKHIKIW